MSKKMLPKTTARESEEDWLARLERKGHIRRPEKKLDLAEWRKLPRPAPDPEGYVLKELLGIRREGR